MKPFCCHLSNCTVITYFFANGRQTYALHWKLFGTFDRASELTSQFHKTTPWPWHYAKKMQEYRPLILPTHFYKVRNKWCVVDGSSVVRNKKKILFCIHISVLDVCGSCSHYDEAELEYVNQGFYSHEVSLRAICTCISHN